MKAIFLDRDGVINRSIKYKNKPFAPLVVSNFIFYPNTLKAINLLKKKFKIFVVTNQPEISKKKLKKSELKKMNWKIQNTLKINIKDIYVCPHQNSDCCICRKPKPGLIKKILKKYDIDISKSFIIGDRKKDIDAGIKCGLKTIFIDRNYNEEKPKVFDYKFKNLYQASLYISK